MDTKGGMILGLEVMALVTYDIGNGLFKGSGHIIQKLRSAFGKTKKNKNATVTLNPIRKNNNGKPKNNNGKPKNNNGKPNNSGKLKPKPNNIGNIGTLNNNTKKNR
jgi:hypothetical protein